MATVNLIPPILTKQLLERFWANVDKTPGHGPKGKCWLWTGSVVPSSGYGRISEHRRSFYAHRLAYFIEFGVWSEKLVCHKCDFKRCVRAETDLFLGTSAENTHDSVVKRRRASGNKNASRLYPEIHSGINNGNAKLTNDQVRKIRQRRADGELLREIAPDYKISLVLTSHVARGKGWKHIQ